MMKNKKKVDGGKNKPPAKATHTDESDPRMHCRQVPECGCYGCAGGVAPTCRQVPECTCGFCR